ncbi:MAG: DUF4850 domain-containing protein [Bacteroidota bacterium]
MKATTLMLLACIFLSCSNNDTGKKQDIVFAPANTKKVTLTVTVLPTADGSIPEEEKHDYNYPKGLSLYGLEGIDEVAAYGAAYRIYLGLKGWTGNGDIATNGGEKVVLFPPGGSDSTGPRIVYYAEPSCAGCMAQHAALYFTSDDLDDYKGDIEIPQGLVKKQVSPTVVTYALPAKNGLITAGVAHYVDNAHDNYYKEATFVLPAGKEYLADLLTKDFINRFTAK